jgi:hypothetical protein
VGNTVIYNGGGLLIDWEMSKDLEAQSEEKTISRTIGYISYLGLLCLPAILILSGYLDLSITSSFAMASPGTPGQRKMSGSAYIIHREYIVAAMWRFFSPKSVRSPPTRDSVDFSRLPNF